MKYLYDALGMLGLGFLVGRAVVRYHFRVQMTFFYFFIFRKKQKQQFLHQEGGNGFKG